MAKQLYNIILICIPMFFLLSSCSGIDNYEEASDNSAILIDGNDKSTTNAIDENVTSIYESINSINFNVQEYQLNYNIYSSELDKVYKEAFLKVIKNEQPLMYSDSKEEVYYRELIGGYFYMENDEFAERILMNADYYYFDFDGDELPELTIQIDGPCILKYNFEEDQVYLHYRGFAYSHILGSNQLYTYI